LIIIDLVLVLVLGLEGQVLVNITVYRPSFSGKYQKYHDIFDIFDISVFSKI